ncbi:MAG: M61 family metallopeptidase [Acidobacteriota bacterium]
MKSPLTFFTLLMLSSPLWGVAQPTVRYTLSLAERESHILQVSMEISGLEGDSLTIALPAWNNLYQIRDFSQYVRSIRAEDGNGDRVPLRRLDKQTWRLEPGADRRLTVLYSVVADRGGSFSAQVNRGHAFINPALVCFYLPEHRSVAHSIRFRALPRSWKVATGLNSKEEEYQADSYEHLVDSPLEASPFELAEFRQGGVLYQVAVHGRQDLFAMEDLVGMIRRVVEYEVELMRGAPFKRYVFLYHISERGSGGMEHRNSTAITLSSARVGKDIQAAAAGVTAHEFFHLWNVRRIHPAAFDRIDFSREMPTPWLWFSEGTTSYYSLLTLKRTGLVDRDHFYRELSDWIGALKARSARLDQSVVDAGWEAWFERYPFHRRPETSVSYYNKGALLSLLLDLRIRHASGNRRSLDDVLRFLNVWFGDRGVGFQEADLQRAMEAISQTRFEDFFSRYVAGVDELPLAESLALAGWHLVEETVNVIDYGFTSVRNFDQPLVVAGVVPGSPAEQAGLRLNDQLLKIDGRPLADRPEATPPDWKEQTELVLEIRRGNELRTLRFAPKSKLTGRFRIQEEAQPSPLQLQIRQGLLSGGP